MSVWNGILQAVHSSLIDELNARWPDEKLELGLPKRLDGWSLLPGSDLAIARRIACAEGAGLASLGSAKGQDPDETTAIFEGVVIRATREFAVRKIDARFEGWVEGPFKAAMTIWLPIRIPTLKAEPVFNLGVSI